LRYSTLTRRKNEADAPSVAVRAWRWLMSVRPPHKDVRASIDIDAYSLT